MNTLNAFVRGENARASRAKLMVFDWEKAARRILETGTVEARAGLSHDWEWTGGTIWSDGKPVPKERTSPYLASIWATPELELDSEIEYCWRYEDETPGWDAGTYWPLEALTILGIDAPLEAADGET